MYAADSSDNQASRKSYAFCSEPGASFIIVYPQTQVDDPSLVSLLNTTGGALSSHPSVKATSFQVHSSKISPLFINAAPSAPSA